MKRAVILVACHLATNGDVQTRVMSTHMRVEQARALPPTLAQELAHGKQVIQSVAVA